MLNDSGGRSEVFNLLLILDSLSDDLYLYMGGEIILNPEFKWYHIPGLIIMAGLEVVRSIKIKLKERK